MNPSQSATQNTRVQKIAPARYSTFFGFENAVWTHAAVNSLSTSVPSKETLKHVFARCVNADWQMCAESVIEALLKGTLPKRFKKKRSLIAAVEPEIATVEPESATSEEQLAKLLEVDFADFFEPVTGEQLLRDLGIVVVDDRELMFADT